MGIHSIFKTQAFQVFYKDKKVKKKNCAFFHYNSQIKFLSDNLHSLAKQKCMKLTNYLVNLVTATHTHTEMDIQDTSTTTHSNRITGQDIQMLSNR